MSGTNINVLNQRLVAGEGIGAGRPLMMGIENFLKYISDKKI